MFFVCERWVRDGDRLLHIDPKFFFDHSSTSSSFCWAAQPWVLRAASPQSASCSHASILSPTATAGSTTTNENSSVGREGSRMIILKSRLKSTGHSAGTSEVRNIFDRHTPAPSDRWQLTCPRALQPRDRRNPMTATVHNITNQQRMICHKIQTNKLMKCNIWMSQS